MTPEQDAAADLLVETGLFASKDAAVAHGHEWPRASGYRRRNSQRAAWALCNFYKIVDAGAEIAHVLHGARDNNKQF